MHRGLTAPIPGQAPLYFFAGACALAAAMNCFAVSASAPVGIAPDISQER
jgi:hypothetical protein